MSNLTELQTTEELDLLKEKSRDKAQIIFKHSTRCMTSRMALNRIDNKENTALDADFYILNIIRKRDISNNVVKEFGVIHESPQLLIIKDGKCVYDESHSAIQLEEIENAVSELNEQ